MPYDITYMWNLKYDTNEPIYKAETDSQTQRTDSWLPMGSVWWEGWTWNLWLVDENYYMQNGWTTRSYCIAQGSIYNVLG